MPSPSIRLAALAPMLAVGAIAMPAAAAVAAPLAVSEPQVCQYSYDQAWRVVPVTLSGTLTDGSGTEIAPGSSLTPGTQVRLTDAVVSAVLPDWIAPFAFDGGIIGNGITQLPVHGWLALEATNTLEGTTAPIRLDTHAVAHADVPAGHAPTDETAWFDPVTAPIPDQSWTATGGDVLVRQAVGTKMAPIPAGRDGGLVQVNGSLFVAAELDAGTRLFLDCLAGGQLDEGANHTDKLPYPLTGLGFRVPGFTGSLNGAVADWSAVDAQLENPGLFRAAAGQAVTVTGSRLRMRLTQEQRDDWLGPSGSSSVTGSVTIAGDRSTVGEQTVTVPATSVPAGSGDVVLDLPATTWTPAGASGIDLRGADTISLTATNGTARTLTLQRNPLRPSAYPFAYVLGPDPRTRFEDDAPKTISPYDPPALDGPKTFAPPPVATRRTTIRIATTKLKRKKGKIRIRLTNLSRTATTKGTFKLVTRSKHKLGKRKKRRTYSLIAKRSFSLKKGKSVTYTVKLSRSATALLRTRRSIKAKLTVTPARTKTQKTVTKRLTVKR